MAIQSVAAATFAVLLAAAAEGVGSAWHCPPLYCPEVVRGVLGLPGNLRPQALVTLGYPADEPRPRPVPDGRSGEPANGLAPTIQWQLILFTLLLQDASPVEPSRAETLLIQCYHSSDAATSCPIRAKAPAFRLNSVCSSPALPCGRGRGS